MRKDFGLALAKAMNESKALRLLLKKKALEMIDEDYDVLFALIRDEELESKTTVADLITKHLKNKARLHEIEKELPTLTIFVPTLPKGSFSAQSWDTENTVPLVGIKSIKTDDVPIVDANGVEAVLPAKYAPGFPIVVVKNSLRILDDSHPGFGKLKSKTKFLASTGKSYKFIDDNFDRNLNLNKKKGARYYDGSELEGKIKSAYEIFPNSDGWQRDHVYYDLTNNTTRGTFKYQFKEALTMIRMSDSNPMGAFQAISDATDGSDPTFQSSSSGAQSTFWTSSSFTFRIHVFYSAKSQSLGTEFTTPFPVMASDLFDVQYETLTFPGFWPWQRRYVYLPTGVTSKNVNLRQELFNWDIGAFTSSILVKLEEVDTQTNIERTVSLQAKQAFNFGLDGGEFNKTGLKFGISGESAQLFSAKMTYQEGSDELEAAIINFGDAILIGKVVLPMSTLYEAREYNLGFCNVIIRPVQVQP